ncbi:MAG: beta-galactosidase [Candidatus Hydrogenedentales bacterium]
MRVFQVAAILVGVFGGLSTGLAEDVSVPSAPASWRFDNGGEFPGATGGVATGEEASLALHYDFTKGGSYVAAYYDLPQPLCLESVAFKVKKPIGSTLTVRFSDNAGQTFQKSITFSNAGWQGLECRTDSADAHFGGPNDGVLRQPIKTIGILAESGGAAGAQGDIFVSEVSCKVGAATETAPIPPAPFISDYVVTMFDSDSGFGEGPGSSLHDGMWSADLMKSGSTHLSHSLPLFGKPKEFTLRVRGGAPGNILKLGLGSHFQVFERTLGTLTGGEQSFTFPAPPEGWAHFGGENDGISRMPLRLSHIAVERGSASAIPTEILMLDLRCKTEVSGDGAIIMTPSVSDEGAEGATRTLSATCKAWSLLDHKVAGTLHTVARSWEGESLWQEDAPFALEALGVPETHAVLATVPAALNFAEIEFRFEAEGVAPGVARTAYAGALNNPGDATLRPDSPWGMGLFLYRNPDNALGYKIMDTAAGIAQAAGVKWCREEFSWASTEPRPGEYDFHFYDEVVNAANRHGISVYGLLSYWSNWTQPYTEQGINDYCRWARAVVKHFKGRVKHWEIYNEPNIFFWSGPKELYPELVKKCYAQIKAEDPQAQVLAISTSGIDRKFIGMCLDAGAPFDILTVHPYRSKLNEQVFIRDLQGAYEQVGKRPVWITEMGWSTQIGGTDERTQAQLLARSYLTAVGSGACQNISWYDFRDDGTNAFYNEDNFGVLRHNMVPKPSYRALATICRTMAAGTPLLNDAYGDGVFAVESGHTVALWCSEGERTVSVKVKKGTPRVVNLMGEPLTVARNEVGMSIALKPNRPVFVYGAEVGPEVKKLHPKGMPEKPADVLRF